MLVRGIKRGAHYRGVPISLGVDLRFKLPQDVKHSLAWKIVSLGPAVPPEPAPRPSEPSMRRARSLGESLTLSGRINPSSVETARVIMIGRTWRTMTLVLASSTPPPRR